MPKITIQEPVTLKPNVDGAHTILSVLYHVCDELAVCGLAAGRFDNPGNGIEGLYALCEQVTKRWHDYVTEVLNDGTYLTNADRAELDAMPDD